MRVKGQSFLMWIGKNSEDCGLVDQSGGNAGVC